MIEIVTAVRRNYRLLFLIPIFAFGVLSVLGSGGAGSSVEVEGCIPFVNIGPDCPSRPSASSSPPSPPPGPTPEDIIPPTTPTGFTATSVSAGGQGSIINLSWNRSSDNVVIRGYKIYRDGVYLQEVSTTSFGDSSLNSGALSCYQVAAIDGADNESAKSIKACASTAWSSSITSVGYFGFIAKTSLALDSNYHVHISYYDGTNKYLYYVANYAGTWSTWKIDSGVYGFPSLAVDASDNVHIAYTSDGIYSLKYATNASGVWAITTVDANWVGLYPALAIDPAGKAHISYYDYQNRSLKYATNASGSWVTNTIDAGYVGKFTSLALDSTGKVHISYYYEEQNKDLKYATNASGVWEISTLDSMGDMGQHTSLAIDSAGKVHISYYDAAHRDLKYATNAPGVWVTSILDAGGAAGTGWQTSVAVDSMDHIHVSYNDWGYNGLKYATNASGKWEVYPIASEPSGGSSITIDASGRAHISSQQSTDIFYSVYSVY